MDFDSTLFSMIGSISLTSLIFFFLFNKNKQINKGTAQHFTINNQKRARKEKENYNKNPVFFLYDHDHPESWVDWINNQANSIKLEAENHVKKHLNENYHDWNEDTLSFLQLIAEIDFPEKNKIVLDCLKRINTSWKYIEDAAFFYNSAIKALYKMSPEDFLNYTNQELKNKSNSESNLERKRMLLDVILDIEPFPTQLAIDVIAREDQPYGIRSYLLRKTNKLAQETKDAIYTKALSTILDKKNKLNVDIDSNDLNILEDLLQEAIRNIGQIEYFQLLKQTSEEKLFNRHVCKHVTKYLNANFNNLTKSELLAICLLKDSLNHEIKRALAKLQNLDVHEINHIILEEDCHIDLNNIEQIQKKYLPIPSFYKKKYEEFKSYFFKGKEKYTHVTNEKTFGGVVILGNNYFEKKYYTQKIAQEENWDYLVINLDDIYNEESYNQAFNKFTNLSKPYLIYIENPQYFVGKEGLELNAYIEKFFQVLCIQALDNKSFLAGDMPIISQELENPLMNERLRKLKSILFPQVVEINIKDKAFKKMIIDEYLRYISVKRFDQKKLLIDQLLEKSEGLNHFQFCYFVIENLKIMLLVFNKQTNLELINKLHDDFFNTEQLI
jgi:hypothetical protein